MICRISAKYYLTNHADVICNNNGDYFNPPKFLKRKVHYKIMTRLGPSVVQDTGRTKNHMQHRRWDYRKMREKLQ